MEMCVCVRRVRQRPTPSEYRGMGDPAPRGGVGVEPVAPETREWLAGRVANPDGGRRGVAGGVRQTNGSLCDNVYICNDLCTEQESRTRGELRADVIWHVIRTGGWTPALSLRLSPNCATPQAAAHSAHIVYLSI
jgi:hypothetical protein